MKSFLILYTNVCGYASSLQKRFSWDEVLFFILSCISCFTWYVFLKERLIISLYLMCRINILNYFSGKGHCAKGHTNCTTLDHNGRGVITSPNYPRNYPDNSNYMWILNTGHQHATVMFSILELNTPKQYSNLECDDDYLKVCINIYL